ncbi:MAG: ABC transporter permease [Myxococcota bacterium]
MNRQFVVAMARREMRASRRRFALYGGCMALGITALALGGVGVVAGVRVFVREKLDTVAVLRALGASAEDVLATYTLLAVGLGAASGIVGAALGVLLQWLLPSLLSGLLPVEVRPTIEPGAVATGIGLGLWLTLLFAAGPLLDLARVPPLRALRRDFAAERRSRTGQFALVGALGASLVAAAIWQAPNAQVGLSFAAGLGAALAALAAAALAATRWLRTHPPRRAPFWLRQGIANLFRPRNHTVATVLAVGFGLFLVSTLHAVGMNVLRQVAVDARPDRPNLLLFDIQPDQVEALESLLAERGAVIVDRAPIVSARIGSLAGHEVSEQLGRAGLQRDLRWALGREYQITYSGELRETERLAAGRWWEPRDLAPGASAAVSLETGIARTLDVAPGDTIGWDVQGVRIDSVVRSLRDVDWGRLASNFFVVFPPGALDQAPQRTFLLLRLEGAGARSALQRDVVRGFPNVSVLDATLILAAADALMREVGLAVRLLASFTVATGFAILLATAATARHERTREVLLLRTLGASTRTLRRIVATEAIALGAISAGVGSGLAILAAWCLARFVFELPFEPPWGNLAVLSGGTLALSAALGRAGVRSGDRTSPLAALRDVEICGSGVT